MDDDYREIANIVGLFSHHIDQREFGALAALFSDMTYRSNGIDYAVSGEGDLAAFYERVVDEANERFAGTSQCLREAGVRARSNAPDDRRRREQVAHRPRVGDRPVPPRAKREAIGVDVDHVVVDVDPLSC